MALQFPSPQQPPAQIDDLDLGGRYLNAIRGATAMVNLGLQARQQDLAERQAFVGNVLAFQKANLAERQFQHNVQNAERNYQLAREEQDQLYKWRNYQSQIQLEQARQKGKIFDQEYRLNQIKIENAEKRNETLWGAFDDLSGRPGIEPEDNQSSNDIIPLPDPEGEDLPEGAPDLDNGLFPEGDNRRGSASADDFSFLPQQGKSTVLRDPLATAEAIFNKEVRKDKKGRYTVYDLPSGDGGGKFEFAGINDRYHPEAAAKLKRMLDSGDQEGAKNYAIQYIDDYTSEASTWGASPGVEHFLRDTYFNRGGGGTRKILQYATGSSSKDEAQLVQKLQGMADPYTALRNARERYEREDAGRDENSKFWRGLTNRWGSVTNEAREIDNRGETGGAKTPEPPIAEAEQGPQIPDSIREAKTKAEEAQKRIEEIQAELDKERDFPLTSKKEKELRDEIEKNRKTLRTEPYVEQIYNAIKDLDKDALEAIANNEALPNTPDEAQERALKMAKLDVNDFREFVVRFGGGAAATDGDPRDFDGEPKLVEIQPDLRARAGQIAQSILDEREAQRTAQAPGTPEGPAEEIEAVNQAAEPVSPPEQPEQTEPAPAVEPPTVQPEPTAVDRLRRLRQWVQEFETDLEMLAKTDPELAAAAAQRNPYYKSYRREITRLQNNPDVQRWRIKEERRFVDAMIDPIAYAQDVENRQIEMTDAQREQFWANYRQAKIQRQESPEAFDPSKLPAEKAKTFTAARRMATAERAIRMLEDDPSFDPATVVTAIEKSGGYPELLKSDKAKQYASALLEFTDAQLRMVSGAAVPEQEVARAVRRYSIAVGDGPEAQALKRQLRAVNIESAFEIVGAPEQYYRSYETDGITQMQPEVYVDTPEQARAVENAGGIPIYRTQAANIQ